MERDTTIFATKDEKFFFHPRAMSLYQTKEFPTLFVSGAAAASERE
jgi:hypothetical protein